MISFKSDRLDNCDSGPSGLKMWHLNARLVMDKTTATQDMILGEYGLTFFMKRWLGELTSPLGELICPGSVYQDTLRDSK